MTLKQSYQRSQQKTLKDFFVKNGKKKLKLKVEEIFSSTR